MINCKKLKTCNVQADTAITNSIDEFIIPIAIMKAGVYNDYLKTPLALENSVKWWEGIPITIESLKAIGDHPKTVIVTNKTARVGQVRNPRWEAISERIIGDAHIDKALCPDWLQQMIVMNGEIKGVSGTYFCDLLPGKGELDGKTYTHEEKNYVPNNITIVLDPACKPEDGCGLNVNSQKGSDDMAKSKAKKMCETCGQPIQDCNDGKPEENDEFTDEDQPLTDEEKDAKLKEEEAAKKKNKSGKKITAKDGTDSNVIIKDGGSTVKNTKGDGNMAEVTIEELQKKITEMGVQMNTMKTEMEKRDADIKARDATIATYEVAKKEAAFLGQFPKESQETAKVELMPIFMKDPSDLVMNHAKRLGELLTPTAQLDKSVGAEHVDLKVNLETNTQDDIVDKALASLTLDEARSFMKGKKA